MGLCRLKRGFAISIFWNSMNVICTIIRLLYFVNICAWQTLYVKQNRFNTVGKEITLQYTCKSNLSDLCTSANLCNFSTASNLLCCIQSFTCTSNLRRNWQSFFASHPWSWYSLKNISSWYGLSLSLSKNFQAFWRSKDQLKSPLKIYILPTSQYIFPTLCQESTQPWHNDGYQTNEHIEILSTWASGNE